MIQFHLTGQEKYLVIVECLCLQSNEIQQGANELLMTAELVMCASTNFEPGHGKGSDQAKVRVAVRRKRWAWGHVAKVMFPETF